MLIKKSDIREYFLFLLTAAAMIAAFILAWNSFLSGKNKFFVSLAFLLLSLLSLLVLYFKFNSLSSELKKLSYSKTNVPEGPKSENNEDPVQTFSAKDSDADLLKGVFSSTVLARIGDRLLKNLAEEFEIVQGMFFIADPQESKYTLTASYACAFENPHQGFQEGEGINGQACMDNKVIVINNLPESYFQVISGLGKGKARILYLIPLVHEKKSLALIEISCFKEIEESRFYMLNRLMREGGEKIHSVLNNEKI